eukprot:snap_masked-scaffold_2-processed-gene-13.14-mRNA-1 protein AED:1.00 eAED:1.00 QI:0/-1/0/0/-1/1/1/0/61
MYPRIEFEKKQNDRPFFKSYCYAIYDQIEKTIITLIDLRKFYKHYKSLIRYSTHVNLTYKG